MTLAPEVARDDMREQIRKPIDNKDLYEGAAEAFRRGWRKVKLYFMCGLPGERPADLGIDVPFYSQRQRPLDEVLPWDHIHIKKGREYLAKEQTRSIVQLEAMAGAV